MKLANEFTLSAKGEVHLSILSAKGEVIHGVTKQNALTTNAKEILSRALGQVSSIDTISVYSSGVLQATVPITVRLNQSPGTAATFQYSGLFPMNSFAGNFDELRLADSSYGDFSRLTGLTLSLQALQQLQVDWAITIK